jgi:hypothetical protein
MKKWDKDELNLLIELFNKHKKYNEIGEILNRTSKSVKLKLYSLGLKYKDINDISVKICECTCKTCGKLFKRKANDIKHNGSINLFCSHSCSAKYNNVNYVKKNKRKRLNEFCLICGKRLIKKQNIYCSKTCTYISIKKNAIERWLNGETVGWHGKAIQLKTIIRKYLKEIRGSKCSKCGWDEKHPIDGKSLTEINHIDGDAKNCNINNLEILCPNCHSMTINFRARNKNSSRNRKK